MLSALRRHLTIPRKIRSNASTSLTGPAETVLSGWTCDYGFGPAGK